MPTGLAKIVVWLSDGGGEVDGVAVPNAALLDENSDPLLDENDDFLLDESG